MVIALVGLYAGGFGLLAARAYDAHETGGAFDLGNYAQALWYAARGEGLRLTTVPEFGSTRFAMHVEPILFLLAPLYAAAGYDPRFLLWFQAGFIGLGGIPLYALARRRLASDWAALGIVFAYLLLPALESVTLFDFHAVGLMPTLVLAGCYFLDRALTTSTDQKGLWWGHALCEQGETRADARTRWSPILLGTLCFGLALATKEDVPLHLFLFGVYLMLMRRRWYAGAVLSATSAVWFYVAVFLIIPAARPDSAHSPYLGFFSRLGNTPVEILTSPLHTPGTWLELLTAPDTLYGIGMLIIPFAITPLLGLPFLIIAAPTFAIALFSSNPLMHRLETYHYAAPAIPFVALAAVDGMARLSSWLERTLPPRLRGNTPLFVTLGVVLIALGYHHYRGYSPLARAFHWPTVTPHHVLGSALAASIPPDAPVVAQAELVPLVANRPYVRVWTGPFDEQAEYYLLDVSHPAFTNRNEAQERLLADIAYEPTVGLVASQDGYLLLKKGAPRTPITPEFFSFILADMPPGASELHATFGTVLQLVGFETARLATDREAEPLLTLYWHVLQPIEQDLFIAIFLLDAHDVPVGVTLVQQPATVWWPTSRWQAGDHIRMTANTFPWWSGDRTRFGYGIGVLPMGADPWDVHARLSVTHTDERFMPIDQGTILPLVRFVRIAGIPYAE
ncbi:MAG: hypothetical protein DDG58_12265 [Ardenticatenia bacterium]|jgi:uncharacterized membrane protein|nr:MAG: hypothetical protein DDG58_12265 [Ardenticatenia bacterium]